MPVCLNSFGDHVQVMSVSEMPSDRGTERHCNQSAADDQQLMFPYEAGALVTMSNIVTVQSAPNELTRNFMAPYKGTSKSSRKMKSK